MTARRSKLKFLITAGPTREYIDSVRFLTNGSSGQTGFACARAARQRGHHVRLITGPACLTPPPGVNTIPVISAADMADAVLREFDSCDIVIMTAAVADYTPIAPLDHKLTKTPDNLTLKLTRTTDILAELGRRKNRQTLIGFALQDRAPRQNARRKLRLKNLDAVILNQPAAMGASHNQVQILCAGDSSFQPCPQQTKTQLARTLIKLAEQLHLKKR